jgi:GT2 family glycosyltransferase
MDKRVTNIPKIIHQIWIGNKPAPTNFMNTWKQKHPHSEYEYIFWNEKEISKRGLQLACVKQINDMSEINGKADIIRWEILHQYGGVFLDADSICIEPFDDLLLEAPNGFAGYENEVVRKGLVATGTMAFPPRHPLCRAAINWILSNDVSVERTGNRAWKTVGPGLLTRMLETGLYPEVKVFPSYYFLPVHHSGLTYRGHSKVYAYQEWGSTKKNYETMNQISLPNEYMNPSFWISVLVCSYNTPREYLEECLESIKHQQGHIGIEVVWINDGSTKENTEVLNKLLKEFVKNTRFTKLVYKELDKNYGISYSANKGMELCSYDIVFRMDSDDIMVEERILKQLEFMFKTPNCVICGSNVVMFTSKTETENEKEKEKFFQGQTNHPNKIEWSQYKKMEPGKRSHWFMNNPSVCLRKSAVLEVGNYNKERSVFEDLELELKLMKRFGCIYNLPDVLVLYRIHPGQVTFGGKTATKEVVEERTKFINDICL